MCKILKNNFIGAQLLQALDKKDWNSLFRVQMEGDLINCFFFKKGLVLQF